MAGRRGWPRRPGTFGGGRAASGGQRGAGSELRISREDLDVAGLFWRGREARSGQRGAGSDREGAIPLPKAEAITALLSPSYNACEEYLTALDDRWDDTPGGGGCDMSNLAGSSPTSLAVLAAIVGAIAARRRR